MPQRFMLDRLILILDRSGSSKPFKGFLKEFLNHRLQVFGFLRVILLHDKPVHSDVMGVELLNLISNFKIVYGHFF